MSDSTKVVLVGIGILVLVILGPIFTLSALNTLFHLGIPLTLGTWAAALWLGILVYGKTTSGKE